MSWSVGVDVGGTFTDLVAWHPDGDVGRVKIPSTLEDQAAGLLDAILMALPEEDRADISEVLHGTTVGTNAVLERKGARTALVTNAGFSDLLEMGRRTRPDVYGLRGTFEPHVPRWRRFGVPGRLARDGTELVPLSEEALRDVASRLREESVESVAVAFLHSYLDNRHETAARDILARALPGVPISISSDVLPEIREFERTVATVLNAYLQPLVSRYLGSLQHRLDDVAEVSGGVRVMQGNGGTVPLSVASSFPIRSLISGPAAGVTGAARIAADLGIADCITCDMGGTSFDVGVIEGGRPLATTEYELEYNVPVRVPTLDVRTIGAGGGSTAYLDKGGLLRVGPHSAGSEPGPIWYGLGGERFTVTDANVLAGRIRARSLGSDFHPAGSEEDIWRTVERAQPELAAEFGSPGRLSEEVIKVVTANMAAAVRALTVRRGRDPRRYALLAFGGAAPLHAVEIARELRMEKVLVPNSPGLLSAYGCLVADYALDAIRTVDMRLSRLDPERLVGVLSPLHDEVEGTLRGYESMPVQMRVLYECQFENQSHALYIEARLGAGADEIRRRFTDEYGRTYSDLMPDREILLRSARIEGRCPRRHASDLSPRAAWDVDPPADLKDELWRPAMSEGTIVSGPQTISAPDSTIFVPAECNAEVVSDGHILMGA